MLRFGIEAARLLARADALARAGRAAATALRLARRDAALEPHEVRWPLDAASMQRARSSMPSACRAPWPSSRGSSLLSRSATGSAKTLSTSTLTASSAPRAVVDVAALGLDLDLLAVVRARSSSGLLHLDVVGALHHLDGAPSTSSTDSAITRQRREVRAAHALVGGALCLCRQLFGTRSRCGSAFVRRRMTSCTHRALPALRAWLQRPPTTDTMRVGSGAAMPSERSAMASHALPLAQGLHLEREQALELRQALVLAAWPRRARSRGARSRSAARGRRRTPPRWRARPPSTERGRTSWSSLSTRRPGAGYRVVSPRDARATRSLALRERGFSACSSSPAIDRLLGERRAAVRRRGTRASRGGPRASGTR